MLPGALVATLLGARSTRSLGIAMMQRVIPDWLLQLVWFLAAVCATGAVWYFLSRNDYASALFSAFGAIAFTVVAICLHRLNDRSARFRAHREALAAFIKEGEALLGRAEEQPLPVVEHNEWVKRVEKYLSSSLDSSFAARFSNFSGMNFFSGGKKNSEYKISIDGHTRRLHEFIRELGP
jgi:hypothetical protein